MILSRKHLHNIYRFFAILLFISAMACQPSVINPVEKKHDTIGETMIRVNKYLLEQDVSLIKKYAERRNINLNTTENGLFYCITKNTNGKRVNNGETVNISYRIELLDGTYCYSSDSTGNKEFKIGSRQVETGLEEGVLLMKLGEEATFIIPPHLAHGLSGNGDRIPARAILVYTVRLNKRGNGE